jgi:hypothetical protein
MVYLILTADSWTGLSHDLCFGCRLLFAENSLAPSPDRVTPFCVFCLTSYCTQRGHQGTTSNGHSCRFSSILAPKTLPSTILCWTSLLDLWFSPWKFKAATTHSSLHYTIRVCQTTFCVCWRQTLSWWILVPVRISVHPWEIDHRLSVLDVPFFRSLVWYTFYISHVFDGLWRGSRVQGGPQDAVLLCFPPWFPLGPPGSLTLCKNRLMAKSKITKSSASRASRRIRALIEGKPWPSFLK